MLLLKTMEFLKFLKKITFSRRDSYTNSLQNNSIFKQISYLQQKGFCIGKSEICLNFLFVSEKNKKRSDFVNELRQNSKIESIKIIEEGDEIYITGKTHKNLFTEKYLITLHREFTCLDAEYGITYLGWGTEI